jgi:hypothetical protein
LIALKANDASKLSCLTRVGRDLGPHGARLAHEPNSCGRPNSHEGKRDDASGERNQDPSPGSPEHARRGLEVGRHVAGPPLEHLADLVFDVKHR